MHFAFEIFQNRLKMKMVIQEHDEGIHTTRYKMFKNQ